MKLQNFKISKLHVWCTLFFTASIAYGDGSFLLLNNSLYKIKFVATVVQLGGTTAYQGQEVNPAPNDNGVIRNHPADAHYPAGSNVPVGTFVNISFTGRAKDFDLEILDAQNQRVAIINVGATLGPVVDTDPARIVYVYNNVDSSGKPVGNKGGAVYFWDKNHPLQSPKVQTF